jgi:hypothetical protein
MATLSFQGQGKLITGTVTVASASIASGAIDATSVTITGAAVGDGVIMNPPSGGMTAGLVLSDARVSTANTVVVRRFNSASGTVEPAAATYNYIIIRA